MDDGALTALRVVVNVGTHHQVAGHLVLLFEKVVESQVGIGDSNGAVVDAEPNHPYPGTSQISSLPLH